MARDWTNSTNQLYATTVSNPLPVSGYPWTLSCWIYADTASGFRSPFGMGSSGGGTNRFGILFNGTNFGGLGPSGWGAFSSGSSIHSIGLHHLVMVANNSSHGGCDGYYDGISRGTSQWSMGGFPGTGSAANRIGVGAFSDSTPSSPFDGAIWECALWDVALTAAEAASLNAGVSPLLIRPQSLKWYCPIAGNVAADPEIISGNDLLQTTALPTKRIVEEKIFYPSEIAIGVPASAASPTSNGKNALIQAC